MSNFKAIRVLYHELIQNINELLELERVQTFQDSDLDIWCSQLHKLSLDCPCHLLEYDITKENCPFYTCKDLEPYCDEKCEKCGVSCEYCIRTSYWTYITHYTSQLDYRRMTGIWNLLVCLYISGRLDDFRKGRRLIDSVKFMVEVDDFSIIKNDIEELKSKKGI